eukprot:Selendium_serpulae@DN6465_c1_g1_i1.p1
MTLVQNQISGECRREVVARNTSQALVRQQLGEARHLQSASAEDHFSPLQVDRKLVPPTLPEVLKAPVVAEPLSNDGHKEVPDEAELKELFKTTWGQQYVKLVPHPEGRAVWETHTPMRIGVVLSGGQAAGGHNVISGIYDYVKLCNPNSQLIGFVGGPQGIYNNMCSFGVDRGILRTTA